MTKSNKYKTKQKQPNKTKKYLQALRGDGADLGGRGLLLEVAQGLGGRARTGLGRERLGVARCVRGGDEAHKGRENDAHQTHIDTEFDFTARKT